MNETAPPATSLSARVSAVAWSLAFVVLGYAGTVTATSLALVLIDRRRPELLANPIWPSILQAAIGTLVCLPLTWLIGRRAMGLSWSTLGWAGRRVGMAGFAKGFLVAVGIATLSLIGGLPADSAWSFDGGTVAAYLGRMVVLLAMLLPAAFFEELAFRGALVAGLATGIGRGGAIGVGAVLFAAAHRNNPDVTALALGNIALAGIFLGATFLTRGGLWTATGAHLGWNLTLAGLGAPVSGLPFEIPWLDFRPGVPSWLTGGPFGPEGGVLATAALALGTIAVLRWRDSREG